MSETATAAQRAKLGWIKRRRTSIAEDGKGSLILRPLRKASSPSLSKSAAAATLLFVALFFLVADGPTVSVRPSARPSPPPSLPSAAAL